MFHTNVPFRGDVSRTGTVSEGLQSVGGNQLNRPTVLTVKTAHYEDTIKQKFISFIKIFQSQSYRNGSMSKTASRINLGPDEPTGEYFQLLKLICLRDKSITSRVSLIPSRTGYLILPISLDDMEEFNIKLKNWVVRFPADTLVYFDEVLDDIVRNTICPSIGQTQSYPHLRISVTTSASVEAIRSLDPSKFETLISFKGVVLRVSQVIPEMQMASFTCTNKIVRDRIIAVCGHQEFTTVINGVVNEPTECVICGRKQALVLNHSKCVFTSKQLVKVQETPENVPEGETPQTTLLYAYDNLIDKVRPGDRATFVAIYKAATIRGTNRSRNVSSIVRTFCDLIHVEVHNQSRVLRLDNLSTSNVDGGMDVDEDPNSLPFDPKLDSLSSFEDVKRHCIALSRNSKNISELLVTSFAPNIWEHEDIKKGLLCQLFGGVTRHVKRPGQTDSYRLRSRGEIHVLLCGDPSTAKSQLLQFVHHLSQRGVYVVGRGTSAAGLTATVTRDPDSKDFILESGAVILSDKGICCIDEFDKMDDQTRAILHEVMEQQSISLAKAGIVCTLHARTAILASANPVQSKYDKNKSVVDNINLPATLLSRFDLIYLVLDTREPQQDRRLGEHLTKLYVDKKNENENRNESITSRIHPDLFSVYIAYAKHYCNPVLTAEAKSELCSTYLGLRNSGTYGGRQKCLSATPRQLESLVRLSESLARMELSDEVLKKHVVEAARLITVATYKTVLDPLSGLIDFEQLTRGVSNAAKARQDELGVLVRSFLEEESVEGMTREEIRTAVLSKIAEKKDAVPTRRELDNVINELESLALIGKMQNGKYILLSVRV